MHIWIDRLSPKVKAVVFSVSVIVFILSICLLISAIADDGNNKFAAAFYISQKVPLQDERWKDFLAYAIEQKLDPKHIDKLREIFGEVVLVETFSLNTLGFAFFNLSMILLAFICFDTMTNSLFITIKLAENTIDRLRRENLIDQKSYTEIINILNKQRENNIKIKNAGLTIERINEQIEQEQEALQGVENE